MSILQPLPPAVRHSANPLIGPRDVSPSRADLEVVCVMNAGALCRGPTTYLMLRVDERPAQEDGWISTVVLREGQLQTLRFRRDLPGIDLRDSRGIVLPDGTMLITVLSHLRLATSTDGVHFNIADRPTIFPAAPYEAYGCQDCRMTEIDGTVYISYAAISDHGIATALASTRDFVSYQRHGLIFAPDNRNVCFFPARIGERFCALHRPMHAVALGRHSLWMARSPDSLHWGDPRRVMAPRAGHWDSYRVGGGAPPILTEDGWLVVYHGADRSDRYCLGVALMDREDPGRVLARHPDPLLEPNADYERQGFFGNVVFTDGAVVQGGRLRVYYGASDTATCLAEFDWAAVCAALRSCAGNV